ncbi:MAG: hypothetical protein J6Y94_02515, partial [Bacteriovoracaceae bacterium]|nr:hypothetical protein [Bacteriovoracaceae bacterium]
MAKDDRSFSYLALSICLFFFSCGRTPSEESDQVIWAAQMKLEEKDCAAALAALQGVELPLHASFLQTKAAVYTCLAG